MDSQRPATLSESLWRHASALRYDALPARVVEKIKDLALDTLGTAIGSGFGCHAHVSSTFFLFGPSFSRIVIISAIAWQG